MKQLLKLVGILVLLLVVGVVVTGLVMHDARPGEGETGDAADAMARRMVAAVDGEAWERTRAVRWTFKGAHRHVWDREGGFAQVRWDDIDARIRTSDRSGVVTIGGREATEGEALPLREKAYAYWINDSFWLNPVPKVFDEGVTRSIVQLDDGRRGLMAAYGGGGLTPGDVYVWILGDDDRPVAWKMWVSIIPIGGLEASWGGWQQLETGAWVSSTHEIGFLTLELSDIEGATSIEALVGDDPFASLR